MKSSEIRNKRLLPLLAVAAVGGAAIKHEVKGSKPPTPPLIELTQIQDLPDGESVNITANVTADSPNDSVESATFKLVNPKKLPKGVSLVNTGEVPAEPYLNSYDNNGAISYANSGTMQNISATLTAPANPKLNGEIPIEVDAVESDGKTHVGYVEVPYEEQPTRPS